MKNTVAILEKPGKMVMKEMDLPTVKDDEVLIKWDM